MLQFHRTSLMTSSAQTVVNTVNTVGVMGKGLAAAFKERYPDMFAEYKILCKQGELAPGSSWLWKGVDQWVLNFATKKHWRNPSKIEYIHDGLVEFRRTYEAMGIREIAFPRLGCGNGGLDWEVVRPLMVDLLHDLPITVYIHDFEKKLGKLEHELPLLQSRKPISFEGFYEDIRELIQSHDGEIRPLMMSAPFYVALNEKCELRGAKGCDQLLAAEEDLFRIWSLLSVSPVSRFDLPETVQSSALKVFSVLSHLPYVRPVNIADRHGRVNLAVECIRNSTSAPVSVGLH
ncbi:macro domain-containing protein [Ruegeria sp. 2012CJ41-6]|uniref:Macro domain-containing protein n=1 Tax=Ruegeria spongiae TaxID=2942209 RepID=A0ABT0Q174_9RHOB|nr:macro domain-containing protein [Ruegeria spongiae]MCL6283630.1 macro domain-containing protein [Ruegeria spongiae]